MNPYINNNLYNYLKYNENLKTAKKNVFLAIVVIACRIIIFLHLFLICAQRSILGDPFGIPCDPKWWPKSG